MCSLTRLQRLSVESNQLIAIPDGLADSCRELRHLGLARNQLTQGPTAESAAAAFPGN